MIARIEVLSLILINTSTFSKIDTSISTIKVETYLIHTARAVSYYQRVFKVQPNGLSFRIIIILKIKARFFKK